MVAALTVGALVARIRLALNIPTTVFMIEFMEEDPVFLGRGDIEANTDITVLRLTGPKCSKLPVGPIPLLLTAAKTSLAFNSPDLRTRRLKLRLRRSASARSAWSRYSSTAKAVS